MAAEQTALILELMRRTAELTEVTKTLTERIQTLTLAGHRRVTGGQRSHAPPAARENAGVTGSIPNHGREEAMGSKIGKRQSGPTVTFESVVEPGDDVGMARRLGVQVRGGWYHVMSRRNGEG